MSIRIKGFSAPQIKDDMFPDSNVLYALPVQLELGLSLESFRQVADLCIPLAGWLMKSVVWDQWRIPAFGFTHGPSATRTALELMSFVTILSMHVGRFQPDYAAH